MNRIPPNTQSNVATATEAGGLVLNRFTYDFADKRYAGNIAQNDLLCIGVVPAGNRLVPHLSRIDMIPIDTGGAPTGDYSIGTADVPAALLAATPSETAAATLFGKDFALATAEVGSPTVDTPIYVKATNASATTPSAGKIVSWLVTRAWDSARDS